MVLSKRVVGAESWARLPQVVAPPIHKEMQGHLLAPPREVICWEKHRKNIAFYSTSQSQHSIWGGGAQCGGIEIPRCKPDFWKQFAGGKAMLHLQT